MDKQNEMGDALFAHYKKTIWRPFMSAVKEYQLVSEGDRIAVCISGGKDSALLALCMRELQRRSPLSFELRFICMDPGYATENRALIEENCRRLAIDAEFFETDVFEAVEAMNCNPCFMCARMRRGYLYRRAKKLGCNKIALGHHYDDAVETLMMSMLYAGQLRGMRPRLRSESVPGMELIRPLYKVRESEILAWRDANALSFLACSCRRAQSAGVRPDGSSDSKRLEMKNLIRHLDALHPEASRNIFRSAHNAVLDSLNGWKQGGEEHSLLEEFE